MKQFMTALGFVAMLATAALANSSAGPWGSEYFTNLEVLDQNGRALRFYDDVLKDRQVVISFIYTDCKEICPVTTSRLARVKDLLGDRASKDVTFVSISVDPANDTPEKLKAYAEAFGTGDGWLFLTGDPANLKVIGGRLGNREERKEQHRNEVVLGNASTGDWARNSAFIEPERLAFDILQLDPEWQATKRDNSKDDANNKIAVLPDRPGEGIFRKLCSSCHTVGVGARVGPDLLDAPERRGEKWLVDFITRPDSMLAKGDPTAVALNEAFPVAVMPTLGLTETDARDIVNYLDSMSRSLREGPAVAKSAHDHSTHDHADQN